VHAYLATLPARLADAVSPEELERATCPVDGAGVTRSFDAGRLLVTLDLDPPADARELCAAWGVERPVAVSPDVHQQTWRVLVAGDELEDLHGRRIASDRIRAGRWEIVPSLAARPAGELPGVVSGASPAYDVHERGGRVTSIAVAAMALDARTLDPSDADARKLLASMAASHPHWRGGWTADPASTFVALYDGGEPVAGAALTDTGAAQLCLIRAGFGAPLLDALEAVARDRGAARLRLDSSAFLYGEELPHVRYGYVVGPPYEGDADVEVWAERDLV
jgi:hypothetical protein